jgi:hypothetical protein
MLEVAAFVAENPGCSKTEAAHGIGMANHNYGQGWGPVDRAIRAGLVEAVRVHATRYALYPPDTAHWKPAEAEPAPVPGDRWQPGHP